MGSTGGGAGGNGSLGSDSGQSAGGSLRLFSSLLPEGPLRFLFFKKRVLDASPIERLTKETGVFPTDRRARPLNALISTAVGGKTGRAMGILPGAKLKPLPSLTAIGRFDPRGVKATVDSVTSNECPLPDRNNLEFGTAYTRHPERTVDFEIRFLAQLLRLHHQRSDSKSTKTSKNSVLP